MKRRYNELGFKRHIEEEERSGLNAWVGLAVVLGGLSLLCVAAGFAGLAIPLVLGTAVAYFLGGLV